METLYDLLSTFFSPSGFLGGSDNKASPCNVGDLGLIHGLRRSPAEGNSNPLQYSCLENSMDRGTDGLQSMGLQRVGHNWSTKTFTLFFLRQNSLFHLIFRATVSTGYYYYFHLKYDLKIGRDVEKLDQGLSTIRYWTCIQVGAGLQRHILSFCPKFFFILFSARPATPQISKLSSAITSSKLVFNFSVLPSRLLPSVLSSSA